MVKSGDCPPWEGVVLPTWRLELLTRPFLVCLEVPLGLELLARIPGREGNDGGRALSGRGVDTLGDEGGGVLVLIWYDEGGAGVSSTECESKIGLYQYIYITSHYQTQDCANRTSHC